MILGTKGRYAVMAMVELALRGNKKPVCLSDIAETQEIPLAYLEQIFCKLKRAGLVSSVKGPGGGYQLSLAPDHTNLADIISAVDESIKMTRCEKDAAGGCMSSKSRCLTHDVWEGLGEQIDGYLRGITLKDICERKVVGKSNFLVELAG